MKPGYDASRSSYWSQAVAGVSRKSDVSVFLKVGRSFGVERFVAF